MTVDFFGVEFRDGRLTPDLEHELTREEVQRRIATGQPVLVKIWVRTIGAGPLDIERLESRLADALAPLGLR